MNINLQPNITGTNINLVKGATQADLTNAVSNAKTYRDESQAFSIVSEDKSIESDYSALNASVSATTASDKATIATTKANEASNSAISASASETVCIAKATIATDKAIEANTSANTATTQAGIATTKATESSTSANTSTTQAGIATTKSSEASISASNALTSANNADISEANALTYRNEAESFANSINPSDLVHISGTETITGNKTFSGTVSGLTKATVGLSNVTNESKDTMFTNPTFTGIVTIPSTTSIGTISSTELGYIDGVTSSIQTQLDSKVAKVTSTDNAIVRFNGITGAVQDSGVVIDDNNDIYFPSSVARRNITFRRIDTVGDIGSIAFNIENNTRASIIANRHTVGGQLADLVFNVGVNTTVMDSSGNLLLKSGTGALGYGTGSGGTVTQLTSKSTAVTLNKPSGRIVMHNAALAAGATVAFTVNNSLITSTDMVYCQALTGASIYRVEVYNVYSGGCSISVKNEAGTSLSDALGLVFCVIKGATV